MGALLVGTDARTVVTAAPEPRAEWGQVLLPAGQQHAVRAGERVALCGASPAIVWESIEFPGTGDTCPVCALLSASLT